MAINFDKQVVCNDDFVQLRVIDNLENMDVGGIVLPHTTYSNERLAFGQLLNVGKTAKEKYGISEGEFCLFDRLSTFAWTQPNACTKYDNIICIANESRTEFHPVKNMVFVKPDDAPQVESVGGVYVPPTFTDRLHLGTITDINIDTAKVTDDIFHVGDRVMLVKGGDVISTGTKDLYIFKYDQLVCKIID